MHPDAMHTIKDVIEHIFNLITGKEDSLKVRKVAMEIQRFVLGSRKRAASSKVGLLCAPFHLTPEDIATANSRVCSVSIPSLDFTPGPIFTRTLGLKSHDWKEVIRVWVSAIISTYYHP